MIGSVFGSGFLPVGLWIATSMAMLVIWGLVIWATVRLMERHESRLRRDVPNQRRATGAPAANLPRPHLP